MNHGETVRQETRNGYRIQFLNKYLDNPEVWSTSLIAPGEECGQLRWCWSTFEQAKTRYDKFVREERYYGKKDGKGYRIDHSKRPKNPSLAWIKSHMRIVKYIETQQEIFLHQ